MLLFLPQTACFTILSDYPRRQLIFYTSRWVHEGIVSMASKEWKLAVTLCLGIAGLVIMTSDAEAWGPHRRYSSYGSYGSYGCLV